MTPGPPFTPRPIMSPREDGAWRIGQFWDPFTPIPDDYRWWRKHLTASDVVTFQMTEDQQAAWLTVDLADGRRVGIWSTEVLRARVITQHLLPAGRYAARMIGTTVRMVDVLTNLPPYQLIPWRPMTDPGDGRTPDPDDDHHRDVIRSGPPPHYVDYQSVWLPPSRVGLDRVRRGR